MISCNANCFSLKDYQVLFGHIELKFCMEPSPVENHERKFFHFILKTSADFHTCLSLIHLVSITSKMFVIGQ